MLIPAVRNGMFRANMGYRCTCRAVRVTFLTTLDLAVPVLWSILLLVCPVLEYASCIYDIQGVVLQQEIETIQNRAARLAITALKLGVWLNSGKTKMGVSRHETDSFVQIGLRGAASIPTDIQDNKCNCIIFSVLKIGVWVANSADPDQIPHSVASDLGLHFVCSDLSFQIHGVNLVIWSNGTILRNNFGSGPDVHHEELSALLAKQVLLSPDMRLYGPGFKSH